MNLLSKTLVKGQLKLYASVVSSVTLYYTSVVSSVTLYYTSVVSSVTLYYTSVVSCLTLYYSVFLGYGQLAGHSQFCCCVCCRPPGLTPTLGNNF